MFRPDLRAAEISVGADASCAVHAIAEALAAAPDP